MDIEFSFLIAILEQIKQGLAPLNMKPLEEQNIFEYLI